MDIIDKISDKLEESDETLNEKTKISKDAINNVLNDIEKLRGKYDSISYEALTLAVFRDIASQLKRGVDIKKLTKILDRL